MKIAMTVLLVIALLMFILELLIKLAKDAEIDRFRTFIVSAIISLGVHLLLDNSGLITIP